MLLNTSARGESPYAKSAFVFAAIVVALIAIAIAPSGASAAISATATISNSSNQAAGHPNTTVTVTPTGDKIRDLVMNAAPGILGNPEAGNPKCTAAQFTGDTCPGATQVGTSSASVVLLFTFNVSGTIYALQPDATDAATLGIILRPPLGRPKIFLKAHVTIRPADGGLNISVPGIPNKSGSSSITVKKLTFVFRSRGGTSTTSGPYFNNAPHSCTLATSTVQVTSYNNTTGSASASFTPTGCTNVPFTGSLAVNVSNTTAGAATGVSGTFTAPTADATIQNSYVRSMQMLLPEGTGINFPNLNAVPALCTAAQLSSDTCPAGSDIGNVSAAIPFLPPTGTGDIYITGRSSSVQFGFVLRGARGQKLIVSNGSAMAVDIDNDGIADHVRATAPGIPQVPSSSTTLNFVTPLIDNPQTCGSNTVTTTMNSWSGSSLNLTNSYTTTGC